ncbi:flagellar assembly protein FliH [Halomonas sp. MCCC 1A17488]|uniref:Flagellar assembly protein FliH n=1 Tax=Billgrantia sulfidoxydans TaxID=2733484 RepID=A0ABX7W5G3_9GAMM|nr:MULTISPECIES: flagellar assembly protein FliH [Halomonas]MCE8014798.1 flagellar assembly protein FliH [Halomonas sp. MCCC 1A17488]MCG3238131.1 flagellar assembly protein FliH [Halomonas sp. MCCC 1A17488]QPP48101.1 flagellar assembly protein FliH [Halomonas sp. SS10-MC5]QTP55390.1 flagellar assembly protein FliH [Halomonas sulfidoxydans]
MSERSPASSERHAPWQRWQMGQLHDENPAERQSQELDPAEQARRRAAFQRQAELKALREKVIQEAREEGYRAGFETGRHEGHAQGLKEGRQEAEQELKRRTHEVVTPLKPLAEQFANALATLDDEIATDLVELALATGQQLAGEALKARPRQVLELVKALLHTEPPLVGQQRLWLNPQDHKLVEEHLGVELAAAGWKLQPDAQLTRGGCRVTSANGELDATWETRWQAVKSQVRRRHSTPPAGDGKDD